MASWTALVHASPLSNLAAWSALEPLEYLSRPACKASEASLITLTSRDVWGGMVGIVLNGVVGSFLGLSGYGICEYSELGLAKCK